MEWVLGGLMGLAIGILVGYIFGRADVAQMEAFRDEWIEVAVTRVNERDEEKARADDAVRERGEVLKSLDAIKERSLENLTRATRAENHLRALADDAAGRVKQLK